MAKRNRNQVLFWILIAGCWLALAAVHLHSQTDEATVQNGKELKECMDLLIHNHNTDFVYSYIIYHEWLERWVALWLHREAHTIDVEMIHVKRELHVASKAMIRKWKIVQDDLKCIENRTGKLPPRRR